VHLYFRALVNILPGITGKLLNCTVQDPTPPDLVDTITSPLTGLDCPVLAMILLGDL